MSVCLKVAGVTCSPSSYPVKSNFSTTHFARRYKFSYLRDYGLRSPFRSPKLSLSSLNQIQIQRFCSVDNDDIDDAGGLSDAKDCAPEHEGSAEKNASSQGVLSKSNEMMKKLRRYGIAGLLSYGLLNTVYYLTTFLLVWFYVAPAPGKMGYLAAVERLFKIMAMVWAGSQVTKIARAGGALALAPFVDRGLSWFTIKFNFESQGKAFMAIVACCLGFAILLFAFVILLWA